MSLPDGTMVVVEEANGCICGHFYIPENVITMYILWNGHLCVQHKREKDYWRYRIVFYWRIDGKVSE